MSLAGFIAALILICGIIALAYLIMYLVPKLPEKVRTIFLVAIVAICLLVLLGAVQGRVYFRIY